MSSISGYDKTSCSRTRLENDEGEVEASLGVFKGQVWFHNPRLGALKLKSVFVDEIDQILSTSVLIKGSDDELFALVGFFKGGKGDSFHAWHIKSQSEPVELYIGENLPRFGGAALVKPDDSTGPERTVLVADGLGRKIAAVWALKIRPREGEEVGFEVIVTPRAKVTSKNDITALAFDGAGGKLFCLSGEEESKVIGCFDLASSSSDDKKNKFDVIKRADLEALMGERRLVQGFLARDYAFRHPKEKNEHLSNWERVFPVGRTSNSVTGLGEDIHVNEEEIVDGFPNDAIQEDAQSVDSYSSGSNSSTEEQSGSASQETMPARRTTRKRNIQPLEHSGKQRQPRGNGSMQLRRTVGGGAVNGRSSPVSLESLAKQVKRCVDSQTRLEENNEYIKETQERILGVLSMLQHQLNRVQGMIENSTARAASSASENLPVPTGFSPMLGGTTPSRPVRNADPPDSAMVAAALQWSMGEE